MLYAPHSEADVPAITHDLLDDVREFIAAGEWFKLVAVVSALHPSDICELAMFLDPGERREMLQRLPADAQGEVLEFAETEQLRALIEAIGPLDLPAALDEVDDRTAAEIIEILEPDEREQTLEALDRGAEVGELLDYPEESVGRLMSQSYVALEQDMTTQQAIEYLRTWKPPSDHAYYLYVTDPDHVLIGVISIRDLLVAPSGTPVHEITIRDVHAVPAEMDREEAARVLQRYNLLALPVTDTNGALVGVAEADELIDVLRDEATEDMYRMVGLDEDESPHNSILDTIRLRLPWLIVNLFTAFIGGFVVLAFGSTLKQAVVLAAFLPIVANQSGVTGTQTATVTVRTLALSGSLGTLRGTLYRELVVGFVNGVAVGLVLAVVALVIAQNFVLAGVLFVSMSLASSLATLSGELTPLALQKFGADPALASSIFVTMITDAVSFLLLLGLGAMVVNRL
ncbi:MAG: magnesium transporter [Dehalococcoidia bacterium]|nr:magnesium transporter [Dehalococcoidia bacterium]